MNFNELTKQRFNDTNSVLCIGLDPIYEDIPVKKDTIEKTITNFLFEIIDNFGQYALAVKPNIAFFEQYGIEGLIALKSVIKRAKEQKIPVILDAKRGDIGNTSKAYAKSAFDVFDADSITLAPYMGTDSLSPFFEYKDKGFFILARTSNPGSKDFQLLKTENGEYLYQSVIKKIVQWNNEFKVSVGAVAGATQLNELEMISKYFSENNCPPLLIPGVGKQGGNFEEVIKTLRSVDYDLSRVFINSSSKILYAYKESELDYLDASKQEIYKMLLK
ncbi:MAG: orotidine 5'-phosphate decarboxylase [Spirochaetes bacterium GWF1_31_7]|nr:MAG: orotidine 5'-phosphate decarboxylase [Spirochaetes bacterium GWE1_32_154]OHD45687.1 MAG: orotidine 5'-phosphate decarboxylase [Spirochaetes bacterium GWE2_31_10]OHD47681.1 MAG: orotidine 5'-phosphate decarboxylase [Spirochaetes bacterium GWF1_31_7]OHD83417.1 MAG: orotidine 5'-phosphate decarboxylase [Spirochaetes bacterium RIFOXYB1_FULL_32_8]HBD94784.1 orotidine-5'-phosphate decarboxylase [Spirochaetia bacterium]